MIAGLPSTIAYGGTDRATTEPGFISARIPTITPGKMIALAPIIAPVLISDAAIETLSSFPRIAALGPTVTSSSI